MKVVDLILKQEESSVTEKGFNLLGSLKVLGGTI